MSGVDASIVVKFVSDDDTDVDGVVVVELDETHENNLDDGELKSTFEPTDQPVFLIHHESSLKITKVLCTAGSVTLLNENLVYSRSSSGLFTSLSTELSIDYADVENLEVSTWYGKTGVIELNSDGNVGLTSGNLPCYCDFDFDVTFQKQYKLTPPSMDLEDDDTYPIYIVVYVSEA